MIRTVGGVSVAGFLPGFGSGGTTHCFVITIPVPTGALAGGVGKGAGAIGVTGEAAIATGAGAIEVSRDALLDAGCEARGFGGAGAAIECHHVSATRKITIKPASSCSSSSSRGNIRCSEY